LTYIIRRAKEKLIGRKALAANETAYKKPPAPKAEPSREPNALPHLGQDFHSSPPSSSTTSPSPESSPIRRANIAVPLELPTLPAWATSQSLSPEIPGPPQVRADLYNLRRPSLPTVIRHTLPSSGLGLPQPPVNMARRGSVERLGGNPYARFLVSRANTYQFRPTSLRESHDQVSLHQDFSRPAADAGTIESFEQFGARPMLEHRASMPHTLTGMDMLRRASMPSDLQTQQSGSIFRMPDDRRMYAISSRTVSAPIPGPLPAPNFSFGRPVDSPATTPPAPADMTDEQ